MTQFTGREAPDYLAETERELDRRAENAEAHRLAVDTRIELLRLEAATNPVQLIADHCDDPVTELAYIYHDLALVWKDRDELAMRLQTRFANRLREIAEVMEEAND